MFYDPVLRRVSTHLEHFWRGVCGDAGLSGVRLHDLRHTYASQAAALSETLPIIGGLLAHRGVATTSRYTHLDDADVLRAAEAIGGDRSHGELGANRIGQRFAATESLDSRGTVTKAPLQ